MWQLNAVYAVLLVLPTTGIVPQNKIHENFKLPSLHPAVYILMQKAVTLRACPGLRKFLSEL